MKVLLALAVCLAGALGARAATTVPPVDDAPASAPATQTPVRVWQRLAGIDPTGWRLVGETPTHITWQRPDGIGVRLEVFRRGADHEPYLYDQDQARTNARANAVRNHAGLVEVQVRHMAHGTYDLVTTKTRLGDISPQSPGSVANAYLMVATFPMPQAIGNLSLFATEGSPTGQREALVFAARALKDPKTPQAPLSPHDPYDPSFDAAARYMDSDAREWDAIAPGHPLTRIRALMPQLLAGSKLADVPETVAAELAAARAPAASAP